MIGRTSASALLMLAVVGLSACEDETTGRPTCDELGELCHDSESDAGQDCHVTAEEEATTEEECLEMEDACRAECE